MRLPQPTGEKEKGRGKNKGGGCPRCGKKSEGRETIAKFWLKFVKIKTERQNSHGEGGACLVAAVPLLHCNIGGGGKGSREGKGKRRGS